MPGFVDTTSYAKLVEFLSVDLRPFGDQIYYFANSNNGTPGADPYLDAITWNGEDWTPLPFESTGWKKGGEQPEKPKINVPDFDGLLYVALKSHRNGIGAEINRYQVLDPGLGANAPYTFESYRLASFSSTGSVISIELATAVDITNAQFLGYRMLRENYPGLGSQLLR